MLRIIYLAALAKHFNDTSKLESVGSEFNMEYDVLRHTSKSQDFWDIEATIFQDIENRMSVRKKI